MTVLVRSLFFLFCCVSVATAADDYNAIFERAVDAIDFEFDKNWAYTETRVDSEHVWVGRYDPRRPPGERWQLLTVDDRGPSADELEEYRKEKAHDHSDNGDIAITEMVEPGSIYFIYEDEEHWLLGFRPGDDDKIMDSIDPTIRIAKPDGQLQYIDLRNRAPIRPAIGVKISKLITRLTFGPAIEDGPMVPLSTRVEAKGRAFLFVSFDEEELQRNSDFEFVGKVE